MNSSCRTQKLQTSQEFLNSFLPISFLFLPFYFYFFFGSLVRNETVDFDGQEKRLNKRSEELLAFGFWQLPQKLRGRIFLTIKQIRRNQTHPMQRKAASPAVSRNRERIIWWW